MLEIEKVTGISDEMRAIVESEWPELAHKLPLASRSADPLATAVAVAFSAGGDGRKPVRGRIANAKNFGWAIYAAGFVIWLFGGLRPTNGLASANSLRRRRHVPTQGHLARCFAEHPTGGEEAHARTITARADRRG
jgi:hypothetical protein